MQPRCCFPLCICIDTHRHTHFQMHLLALRTHWSWGDRFIPSQPHLLQAFPICNSRRAFRTFWDASLLVHRCWIGLFLYQKGIILMNAHTPSQGFNVPVEQSRFEQYEPPFPKGIPFSTTMEIEKLKVNMESSSSIHWKSTKSLRYQLTVRTGTSKSQFQLCCTQPTWTYPTLSAWYNIFIFRLAPERAASHR